MTQIDSDLKREIRKMEISIPPLWILSFLQLVVLINGDPNKCQDYTIHRHMKLNDRHVEKLTKSEGIKTVHHCQERDSHQFAPLQSQAEILSISGKQSSVDTGVTTCPCPRPCHDFLEIAVSMSTSVSRFLKKFVSMYVSVSRFFKSPCTCPCPCHDF